MTVFVAHARRERRTACVDADFHLCGDRTSQASRIGCENRIVRHSVPLFTQKVNFIITHKRIY